jgi:hypothetical protein
MAADVKGKLTQIAPKTIFYDENYLVLQPDTFMSTIGRK